MSGLPIHEYVCLVMFCLIGTTCETRSVSHSVTPYTLTLHLIYVQVPVTLIFPRVLVETNTFLSQSLPMRLFLYGLTQIFLLILNGPSVQCGCTCIPLAVRPLTCVYEIPSTTLGRT